MCRYNWHSARSLGWSFPNKNIRKVFYQTALGNCYGLKLRKCWSQLKNEFIVSFIIIFGTFSFLRTKSAVVLRGIVFDKRPVWALGRCRISPPRFLAECCKRQLNQGSFVLLYFRLFPFSDLYWVCLYFPVLFCLSVSVKWLAVKTASEMISIVSSGALNSTQTKPNFDKQTTSLRAVLTFFRCRFTQLYFTRKW